MHTPALIGVLIALGLVALILLVMLSQHTGLWLRARRAGTPIALMEFPGMTLRKVNPRVVVGGFLDAHEAGLHIPLIDLEAHHLAGCDVAMAVRAMIAASEAAIETTWQEVAALNLVERRFFEDDGVTLDPFAFHPLGAPPPPSGGPRRRGA